MLHTAAQLCKQWINVQNKLCRSWIFLFFSQQVSAPVISEATANPQATPLLHHMSAAHAYIQVSIYMNFFLGGRDNKIQWRSEVISIGSVFKWMGYVLWTRPSIQILRQCARIQHVIHLSWIHIVGLFCIQMAFENWTISHATIWNLY